MAETLIEVIIYKSYNLEYKISLSANNVLARLTLSDRGYLKLVKQVGISDNDVNLLRNYNAMETFSINRNFCFTGKIYCAH